MIAILETPDVRSRAMPINVDTYHWMIAHGMVARRAELIRGVIIEKMSKSSLHSILAKRFYDWLLRTAGPGWYVRKEDPLTLCDSEPEPDITVVRGSEADFLHAHPRTAALVVEIAVSSEATDREMIVAYAEAGVEECWLVLGKRRQIECYTEPRAGAYQTVRRLGMKDTLVCTALPGVSLDLSTLFPPATADAAE